MKKKRTAPSAFFHRRVLFTLLLCPAAAASMLSATTPTPTGTPTCTPGPLWYNGDYNGGKELSNEDNTSLGDGEFGSVYDDFNVPSGGWTLTSVFSDNLENTNVTGALWEIRQGISEGNGGTLIASGINNDAGSDSYRAARVRAYRIHGGGYGTER